MKNFNILFLCILFGFNSSIIFPATDLDISVPEACLPDRSIENTVKDKFDFNKSKKNNST